MSVKKYLIALLVVGIIGIFGGCGGGEPDTTDDGLETDKLIIDVTRLDKYFIEYQDGENPNMDDTRDLISLNSDTNYLLVFEVVLEAREDNDATESVDMVFKFTNNEVFSAKFQDTSSGNSQELPVKNPDTGEQLPEFRVNVTVPEFKDGPKTINVSFKIKPQFAGESNLLVQFESSELLSVRGNYADGLTTLLTVLPTKLDVPEISFNEISMNLEITHVANAEYYTVEIDGTNEIIDFVQDGTTEGSKVYIDLSSYAGNIFNVRVQADSSITTYTISDFTDYLTIDLR